MLRLFGFLSKVLQYKALDKGNHTAKSVRGGVAYRKGDILELKLPCKTALVRLHYRLEEVQASRLTFSECMDNLNHRFVVLPVLPRTGFFFIQPQNILVCVGSLTTSSCRIITPFMSVAVYRGGYDYIWSWFWLPCRL